MAKAASRSNRPDPLDGANPEAAPAGGPQIIDVPRCAHCKSDRVKIVSTQGVRVGAKRWQRQGYKCANPKCKGHVEKTLVMRGPYGINVAGDKGEAAKVNIADHRKSKAASRQNIQFANGG